MYRYAAWEGPACEVRIETEKGEACNCWGRRLARALCEQRCGQKIDRESMENAHALPEVLPEVDPDALAQVVNAHTFEQADAAWDHKGVGNAKLGKDDLRFKGAGTGAADNDEAFILGQFLISFTKMIIGKTYPPISEFLGIRLYFNW